MNSIDDIKASVDIVDIISKDIELKPKGVDFIGLCPYHNDTNPSLSVSVKRQIFKCFSCGSGGDLFNWIKLYHKCDFSEALKILKDNYGVNIGNIKTGKKLEISDDITEYVYRNNHLKISLKKPSDSYTLHITEVNNQIIARLPFEIANLNMGGYEVNKHLKTILNLWGYCLAKNKYLFISNWDHPQTDIINWLIAEVDLDKYKKLITEALAKSDDAVVRESYFKDAYPKNYEAELNDIDYRIELDNKVKTFKKNMAERFKN